MPPKVGQRATKDDMSRHGMGNTAAGKYGGMANGGGAGKKGSVTGGKTNSQREGGKHTEVK